MRVGQDMSEAVSRFIWMNGGLVPWEQATLHVTSEAILRGSSVFEGLRAYPGATGEMFLFRVSAHLKRLRQSAKIMRLPVPYSDQEILVGLKNLINANGLDTSTHIRITAYFGEGAAYAWEPDEISNGLFMYATPAPSRSGVTSGIRSCVSTWQRNSDNASPSRVKSSANYQNSRLAQVEARLRGSDVPLMLNGDGHVAESPSSCVFMVRDGNLVTPGFSEDILESVTRDTIIALARDRLGLQVVERPIDRTELYICDELLLCGSGHEILPICEIDGYSVGTARVGAITTSLTALYFDVVHGRMPNYKFWLDDISNLELT